MARRPLKPKTGPASPAPFPSKDAIAAFVAQSPTHVGKREIAKAFQISGADRIALKAVLREMEDEGLLAKGHRRALTKPDALPPVTVVTVQDPDSEGDLWGVPEAWDRPNPPPRVRLSMKGHLRPPPGPGDRLLVRLTQRGKVVEGYALKRLVARQETILGVFRKASSGEGGFIQPTDKKLRHDYHVPLHGTGDAQDGALVLASTLPGRRMGPRAAEVREIIGSVNDPKATSLIAIHRHGIPVDVPPEALAEAEAAGPPSPKGRVDLRAVPLVTIDGADARDFDDAVFAEPWEQGGWHLIVAIADVAAYVRPGSALDESARERGNSVYFPDRVVPMLPEVLSNGWCSLRPDEDRGCLAMHLWIGDDGALQDQKIERALMRSAARLTYEQAQAAMDGHPDDTTGPLLDPVIRPLYGAYAALAKDRDKRGALDLDLKERQVLLHEDGSVRGIVPRSRLDSHRLIEVFMIAANVAAATLLEQKRQPVMYRVHEPPDPDRVDALAETLKDLDLSIARGSNLRPAQFNGLLAKVKGEAHEHMVNMMVLRTQSQAVYSPENHGHFGLALRRYAHFTSPIRRYADLLVHRALIRGFGLGKDGLRPDDDARFVEWGEHISATERRAITAERDALDRFTASYLSDRVGADFAGRIGGMNRAGMFVTLDETGADGLIPLSSLEDDYYRLDASGMGLVGRHFGRTFRLGDVVTVRLREATPLKGGLLFELMEHAHPPGRGMRSRDKTRGKPRRKR